MGRNVPSFNLIPSPAIPKSMRFPQLLLFMLFALFATPANLSAQQTLALVLRDAETEAPIEDAFVFFSGSSAGGISDAEGKVELQVEEYLELVISHLNYETKVLSVAELQALTDPVILLRPSAIKIEEVTVSFSAKDANKRKRRMKRFISAFLGPKRDRKGVRILNPEAILFQENAQGLRADARDRIKIANDALGYELSFLLDTFLLTPQEEIFYGGKVFFQDLEEEQPARAASWKEARRKNFARSKAYFFQQLARGQLDERRFDIGISRFDKDLQFLSFTSKSVDKLRWRRGLRADTLYFDGFFTAVDQSIVTKWTNQSAAGGVVADEYATTFLQSRSGKFVVSPGGVLLNNQEIEEIGYWADQRVARLLPTNYVVEERDESTAPLIDRLVDSLANRQRVLPQEKVYLHLDKPYYSVRDDIWFQTYLVDAAQHRRQAQSKVVHVELIDPKGKVMQSLALHEEQTFSGHFALDSTAKAGLYHLRAYTDYMRNGSKAYLFYREVPVYDPSGIGDGQLTGVDFFAAPPRKDKVNQQPFQLDIYPEGGTFIGGVENTLILRSLDTLGQPIVLSGEVINLAEESVASWTTSYAGRGVLKFTPAPGKPYWAQVTYRGVDYRVRLPEVAEQGMALHVNNLREDDVYIRVSNRGATAGAMLVGHVRGEVFCRLSDIPLNEEMAFPRSQIQQGVATLSLFTAAGELVAERLFYNHYAEEQAEIKVEVPYAFFRPRQRVRLELSWADSLMMDAAATLSVSVTDKAIVERPSGGETIESYLLLNADVLQQVEQPSAFLEDPDQRGRFLLDLELATDRWARFDWPSLLLGQTAAPAFAPQFGETLSGYVTPKGAPEEREMAEVVLTALHPQPTIMKVLTDASGNFTFPNLPYLDTVNYVLQAARFDPKRFNPDLPILTSKNRRVDIFQRERKPLRLPPDLPTQTVQLPQVLVDNFAMVEERDRQAGDPAAADWSIDLGEVTVTGKKEVDSRNFDVYDLKKLDWIEPRQPVFNLLGTLKPGYRFIRDLTRNRLVAEVNDGYGFIVRRPVSISIDGSTASFGRFIGLKADMIKYIVITRTSIAITTEDNLRSGGQAEQAGIASFQGSGFYPGRAFPAPDYAVTRPGAERPDVRTTVHWEPNLRLEAGGKAVLDFYAADIATDYEVRIEGLTDTGVPVVKTMVVRIAE